MMTYLQKIVLARPLSECIKRDQYRSKWIGTRKHSIASLVLVAVVVSSSILVQVVAFRADSRFFAFDMLAFFLMGVTSHSLGVLGHETYHHSFFVTKKANDFAGKWIFHYPLLGRFQVLREAHLQHHRLFGSETDPDRDHWGWDRGDRKHFRRIMEITFGIVFLRNLLNISKQRITGGSVQTTLNEKRSDEIGIIVTQVVLFLTFTMFLSWQRYFLLYLMPIVTIGALIEHLRVFCEHNEGVLRVYSRPSRIGLIVFGRANFRMHAIHHLTPSTPWFALGNKYESVNRRSSSYVSISTNYWYELKKIFK